MTAIVARSPLHPLSMNGAQTNGNKRKSTRLPFDPEDDAPPTKKTRGDVAAKSASTHAANSGKNAGMRSTSNVKTRARKAYDEDDDGFSFSRTRSTRTKGQPVQPSEAPAEPAPTPAPEKRAAQDELPTDVAAPAPRQKKKPRKTLPVSPEQTKLQKELPRRRSKRLSGNHDEDVPMAPPPIPTEPPIPEDHPMLPEPSNTISTPKQPNQPIQHEESPQLELGQDEQELQVEKKRRLTKIPLPFADTPIIRRNKEMRKLSAEQSRRSSAGMRGRRASSLIDTGTSHGYDSDVEAEPEHDVQREKEPLGTARVETLEDLPSFVENQADSIPFVETAVPHTEVETQELYKHISQDLIEPKRMRQLLVWCGNRALPEKPSGGAMDAAETAAMHAARVIQEELLNEFGSKNELSSWFDREDVAPTVVVKKPNPRNIQNADKLQQLEAELARLQVEKRSWDDLISATSGQGDKNASRKPSSTTNLDPSSIDRSLLDSSQAEILNTLLSNTTLDQQITHSKPGMASESHPQASTSTASMVQQRIGTIAQSLEFTIDQFADSTHRMEQYRQTAERVADRILASGAQQLEDRDQKLRERHGGGVDAIDTLRSLSKVLHGKGKGMN